MDDFSEMIETEIIWYNLQERKQDLTRWEFA